MASRRTHPDAGARVPVVLPVLADSVYPISSVIPVDKANKVSRVFISLANHLTWARRWPYGPATLPAGSSRRGGGHPILHNLAQHCRRNELAYVMVITTGITVRQMLTPINCGRASTPPAG
jgi:hypothetical protein